MLLLYNYIKNYDSVDLKHSKMNDKMAALLKDTFYCGYFLM